MANTYTWFVSQLVCYPEHGGQNNVAFKIIWRMNGADGKGHFGEAYGSTPLDISNLNPFTPFEQLTEAQVIGWLEATLGVDGVAAVKEIVDNAISKQAIPPVVAPPLPWAPPEPAPMPLMETPNV